MTTAPSGTLTGQAWLENFWSVDRDVARFLLDSLQLYSDTLVRTSLHKLTTSFTADSTTGSPVAIFPVRDPIDFAGVRGAPTAFVDFDPRILSPAPGSEAAAANLARQVAKAQAGALGPEAGIREWKDRKVRSVLLIEDFAASGDQAYSFMESLARNRTLRSWHSYGLISFHLFFFAATIGAVKRLKEHPLVGSVNLSRTLPDIYTVPLDPLLSRSAVLRLCRRYGRGRLPELGHQDCGSLFARQSSVPDGLPSIFLQTGGYTADGKPWRPLFPGRNLPGDLEQLCAADYRPNYLDRFLSRFGDQRLAASYRRNGVFPTELLPIVLIELRDRLQSAVELAHSTNTPLTEVQSALATLQGWSLIDGRHRLTDDGRAEARALTHPTQQVGRDAALSAGASTTYYPLQLRRVDRV